MTYAASQTPAPRRPEIPPTDWHPRPVLAGKADRRARQTARLAVALVCLSGLARSGPETLVDSFDSVTAFTGNTDGGNPPLIQLSPQGRRGACMELRYRDRAPHWGNVRRDLLVPPDATALRFWVRVLRATPDSAFYLWLFEQDGDAYLVRVALVPGKSLADVVGDWIEVTVPFSTLRFQPRGNKKREFLTTDRMLFGCNYADFDIRIDELRILTKEATTMDMPGTPDLSFDKTAAGNIGILAEETVAREPGHASPTRLATLFRDAGYGATLLRAGDVCDALTLTPEKLDVLVIPCAPFYPAAGKAALRQYLKNGGSFISIGGYAFDTLLARTPDGWKPMPPDVAAADMDRQGVPDVAVNTRYGKHSDTMQLNPEQVGIFDPSYLLERVAALRVVPNQCVLRRQWSTPVSLSGPAAVAMTGSNSPVFPRAYGRWIPVLEAADRFGRSRGPVGSVVYNFDGPYKGASYAFFGVTNRDLFDGAMPEMDAALLAVLDRLRRPAFITRLGTDLACYRRGEDVVLTADVVTRGRPGEELSVRFVIDGMPVGTIPVSTAGATQVSLRLTTPPFEHDMSRVVALLETDGIPLDRQETGFVVWSEDVIAQGPSVAQHANYLDFRGKTTFLAGVNQTGVMWFSTRENPLVWQRDFEKMEDHAQNMLRILHFSPFARESEEWRHPFSPLDLLGRPLATQRKTDAIVQLAQKHGVIVFLTLHDWMPVELTDDELAAQRDWNHFWADRYRTVPGIMFDIQNEPSVRIPAREDMKTLCRTWLAQRYGSIEKARTAWLRTAGSAEIDFRAEASTWEDLRARDLDLFRTVIFDRWTRENAAGVKSAAPDKLVTVGFLPNLTSSDKILGVANVDYANTHYYGSVQGFRTTLKMIDRRFEGKGFSVGEFGSREAHDARTHGHWGDPAQTSINHYLAVAHYSLGMGASFIANWDWKELKDAVFPWGINHSDLVSKPVLEAYRNVMMLMRPLRPVYRSPCLFLVVPDSHRFGYRTREVHAAVQRAVEALFDCHADFGVINEFALAKLPKDTEALIWPVPFCPEDDTFSRVEDFTASGGSLLVTGDVRFDADRQPARGDRVVRLGLTPDIPPQAPWTPEAKALPLTPVKATGTRGTVWWVPRPVELVDEGAVRELYHGFLTAATVPMLSVAPADAPVHVFDVPVEDGSAVVAYNDGDVEQTVTLSKTRAARTITVTLLPHQTALVYTGTDGRLLAAEGTGSVVLDGIERLVAVGRQAIMSLDGSDINTSGRLLAVPFGTGRLELVRHPQAQTGLVSEIGEFRGGKWRTLETNPASTQPRRVVLQFDEQTAYDFRIVAPPSKLSVARTAASNLLYVR